MLELSANSVSLRIEVKKSGKVWYQTKPLSRKLSGLTSKDPHDTPSQQNRQRDVTDRVKQHFLRTDDSRRTPQQDPNLYYRSVNLGAVDARDLAAPPNSASRPPKRTTGGDRASALRSPLDARSLGAQRSDDRPRVFNPRPRSERNPRDPKSPRIIPRRDASDRSLQGGTSSAQHNRSRAPQGGNTRPPRSGAPAGPRKRERLPRSNIGAGPEREKEVGDVPSEEELAYLNSRDHVSIYTDMIYEGGAAQYLNTAHRIYKPAETSADTLQGMGPALACGEWGMSETVGERIIQVNKAQDEYDARISDLAQKFSEGEFVHFNSKQERIDTLKTVERNLAGQGDNAELDEEKEKEKMEIMDTRMTEERKNLATRLLKGDYYIGPLGKGPTAQLLERYTRRNETYMPKDREALARKIGTLLPLDKGLARAG
ncbi:MAG: hypothetical protein Q9166_002628 [cf. Caloplaca sp. 2 TL-2023]